MMASEVPPPALLQPLSLQQSSINCIVTNLEKYPPDLLALLPLHFRRELLLLLPPADIFQLEQTKFIEGIDMENEIWKVVSEHYDFKAVCTAHIEKPNVKGNPFEAILMELHNENFSSEILPLPEGIEPAVSISSSSSQLFSWKAHYVSCLVSFLFYMKPLQLSIDYGVMCKHYCDLKYRNYIVLLQFLFCNRFFNLKQLTDVGGFPLQVSDSEVTLLPSRYSRFFTSLVSCSKWVRFLLEDCHIEPLDIIKIDLEQFNIESGTSFQHFLRNAKDVRLFMKYVESSSIHQRTTNKVVLEKITKLCSILSLCQELESLEIVQNVTVHRRYFVTRVADQSQFNMVLQKCFLHNQFVIDDYKPPDLFQSLKCISITGYGTEIELSTLCSLFALTQNHDFQSISVSGPIIRCDEHQKEVVIQALNHFSTSPISSSCCLISLSDMKQIPFSFLFWLMKLFLYSPSTITQKMVLSSCEIDYSVIHSEKELKSIPEPPDLAGSHKCLHLSKVFLEHTFIKALTHLPLIVLDEFHVHIDFIMYRHHWETFTTVAEGLRSLFVTLPTIPVCRIRTLTVQIGGMERTQISLGSQISNIVGPLFELAQNLPETAVSLQCGISSNYIEVLLANLHDEWKKNGGSVLLDQLLIHLSDSCSRKPNFHAEETVKKSLIMMGHLFHDIARNVDIKQKNYGQNV